MKQGFELTGQNVQGYKISKPIGQGKFSIVYKAENQQAVTFALKKIKIFDMADQKQREKCLKQVDLMKALNHPNIIQYIDSFIHNNQLIIVTEWADKGDLKKLIRQHEEDQVAFDESVIWRYMKQISSALYHMHDKRIMHRDLKPANIFIGHDYTLKIGDLGLGRSFSSQTLEAYSKVGTPLYMSPELIQDSGYNENADVWSLGCIIYELCELNSPFRNKKEKMSLMDLFDNITKCNYKPISSRYSQDLSQAIRNMIVVDPSKRWSSEQVFRLANKMVEGSNQPKLDPIITMDDIYVKLSLLNYVEYFCKAAQRKPINKFYFAIQDPHNSQNDQLFYLLELCYWIMSLNKPNQKKEKLAIYSKTLIDWKSPQNACIKFISDLNNYGVKTENIEMGQIIEGYGQYVCYLLNQVLNRELIRSNFQFMKPSHDTNDNQTQSPLNLKESADDSKLSHEEIDDFERKIEEDDFEQSEFEQSIFFNKNQRKEKHIAGDFLQKIQEFDNEEDRMIIYSKIDEREWRIECERLTKSFNEMSEKAKTLRKKNGYQNFEIAKVSSSKLTDLIHYVKPASTVLLRKIEVELEVIKKSEQQINSRFKDVIESKQDVSSEFKQLSTQQFLLQTTIRERMQQLQKTEEKMSEIEVKIKNSSNESENNSTRSQIKQGIARLEREIVEMEQKKGIVLWELTKMKVKSIRKEDVDFLAKFKNQDLEQF